MNKQLCIAAVLALGVGAQAAPAAILSYSADFRQQTGTNPASNGGDFSANYGDLTFIELPRFNGAVGLLQNVSLSLASTFSLSMDGFTVDLEAESAIPFVLRRNDAFLSARSTVSMLVKLFDPDNSVVVMNRTVQDSCEQSISQLIGGPDNGFAGCSFNGAGDVRDSGELNWDFPTFNFALADFQGDDPLNLYAQSLGSLFGFCDDDDDGDSCNTQTTLVWSGLLTVTYEYMAIEPGNGGGNGGGATVPEPGTLALLGLGLIRTSWSRRRAREDLVSCTRAESVLQAQC